MQFINLGKLFDGQGLSEILLGTFKGFSSVSSMDNIRKELFNTQMKIGTDGIRLYLAGRMFSGVQLGIQETFRAVGYGKTAIFNRQLRNS